MQVDSFIQNLRKRLDEVVDPVKRLNVIADDVAAFYALRSHEIGLFSVNQKKHEIVFMLPEGMAKTGHIPLNAVNSLVARTANDLKPVIDNDFVKTRHLFMFEHMLADKSNRITMQKIMSVPILANGVAKGVIQVGRKGATLAEAGADFTEQNLADLVTIAAVIAEYDIQLS